MQTVVIIAERMATSGTNSRLLRTVADSPALLV
jgi:hypothetical protein